MLPALVELINEENNRALVDGSVSPTWFWSSESEGPPYSGLKLIHIYPSVHPSSYLLSPSVSMLIPVFLLIHFSPFLLFQDIQYITSECVLISIGKWCRVSVLTDILCQKRGKIPSPKTAGHFIHSRHFFNMATFGPLDYT